MQILMKVIFCLRVKKKISHSNIVVIVQSGVKVVINVVSNHRCKTCDGSDSCDKTTLIPKAGMTADWEGKK